MALVKDCGRPQEALWHLASIGCPWQLDPKDVLMAMLTGSFDASGDQATPYFCVAGFVSSEDHWRCFSELWSKRLSQDGITFFRAVDAAFFTGPFQHWSERPDKEQLRRALFQDLMDILKSNVYHRFGCIIRNKLVDEMSKELKDKFRLGVYTLASLSCERQFRQWVVRDFRGCDPNKLSVRMVFEDGDDGFGDLSSWINAFKGTISVSREPKKDTILDDGITRYGFVPLQAADWLAYELRLSLQHFEEGRIRKRDDFRWGFKEFEHILGDAGTYTSNNIKDAEQKLAALKASPDWDKVPGIELMSRQVKMRDV